MSPEQMLGRIVLTYLGSFGAYILVSQTRGPFAVFSILRDALGVEYDDGYYSPYLTKTELGKMIMCKACSVFWYSIIFVCLMFLYEPAWAVSSFVLSCVTLTWLID